MSEQKEVEETTTQKLQNKVDKLKLLNLTSNIHDLTPRNRQDENSSRDIALVQALSVSPRIVELFLEIRGLEYNSKERKLIQVSRAIMNIDGAYRFCKLIKRLAE